MIVKRIVEALENTDIKYEGADRLPGTDAVRTYVTGAWLYSKESDLGIMLENRHVKTSNAK